MIGFCKSSTCFNYIMLNMFHKLMFDQPLRPLPTKLEGIIFDLRGPGWFAITDIQTQTAYFNSIIW